jgi:glycine/D-amino acid oxidase-like deaminating enzyme
MSDRFRVVICGAGIAGVSAAYYLAKAGVRDIILVDERPPLTLTSDRSSEGYRNWWPDAELRQLMNRSIDLMEGLAGESGNVFRMNRRGYVYVTADPANLEQLQRQAARIAEADRLPLRIHSGQDTSYSPPAFEGFEDQPPGADLLLGANLVHKHFSLLSERAIGALHVRRAGWLSAQQLGMYLLERGRALGVQFRSGRVEGLQVAGNAVRGVRLSAGDRLDCETFVNAAGPYFKQVGRLLGLDLPVETELHLKVAFEDSRGVLDRAAPLMIWNDPQLLPWEEEERSLLASETDSRWLTEVLPGGAHTRPEGSGESRTILMLWDYRRQSMEPVFPHPLDDQYPEVVLRGLCTMLPGLRAYVGRSARPRLDGGYYVRTPENRLLVGPTPLEGAYLIGAVSGYGIMSACAAGELLASHILGGQLPAYASAFALSRYEDPGYRARLANWGEDGQL